MITYFVAEQARSSDTSTSLRPSAASLRQKVHRLNPALAPTSTTFQAAVLLLAAEQIGHNIERLARFTSYSREFVAKCARRLYDNGVWKDGSTVSDWNGDNPHEDAFWADVSVAEGRASRRILEGGSIEWALAGVWTKSYDYIEREGPTETTTRYLSSEPELESSPVQESNFLDKQPAPARIPVRQVASLPEGGVSERRDAASAFAGVLDAPPSTRPQLSPQDWSPAQPSFSQSPNLAPDLFASAVWLT